MDDVEGYLRQAAQVIAMIAEGCGAAVALVAVLRAFVNFVGDMLSRVENTPQTRIRLTLGRGLALALEFLLAADIVRTAIAPTWEEIAQLAAIAAIRTALNYFLQKEIEREQDIQQAPLKVTDESDNAVPPASAQAGGPRGDG